MKTDSQRAAYRVPSIACLTSAYYLPGATARLRYAGYDSRGVSVYGWFADDGFDLNIYGSTIATAIDEARAAYQDAIIRRNV